MHVWDIFVVNEKHDVRRGKITITMVKDNIRWIQYKGLKWEPTNFECHIDYGSNYFTIFRIILTLYRSRNGRWETTLETIHSCMYNFYYGIFDTFYHSDFLFRQCTKSRGSVDFFSLKKLDKFMIT